MADRARKDGPGRAKIVRIPVPSPVSAPYLKRSGGFIFLACAFPPLLYPFNLLHYAELVVFVFCFCSSVTSELCLLHLLVSPFNFLPCHHFTFQFPKLTTLFHFDFYPPNLLAVKIKLSPALVTATLAIISVVYAAPLQRRAGVGKKKKVAETTSFDSPGAVYFLTNEPNVNQILVASINVDGTLKFDSAIEAGGRGSHGESNGPDALFSQGSIKASKKGQDLATVNAGSNTIALFSIDPKDPTNLAPFGDPVSSEGEFPVSIAFNSDGTRLCVLNGGTVSGVNCCMVDKKLGPVAIANSLSLLSHAGALKGTQTARGAREHGVGTPQAPGCFAIWNVSADGSLSKDLQEVAPAKGGALPFGMPVIPGKRALLATDAALEFDVLDLDAGNKRSSAHGIKGQVATCWFAFSPKTGNFYLSDVGTSTITEVHVDNNLNGTVAMEYPQISGSAILDLDIASVNGRDFVYILAANTTSVDVIAIDFSGMATKLTAFTFAGLAKTAGVTINPNNLQGVTTFTA